MHASRSRLGAAALLASLTASSLAPVAARAAEDDAGGARFGIGVVTLRDVDAYAGIDPEWAALPVPLVEIGRFSLFGPRAAWALAADGVTLLSLVATYDFAGFDAKDGTALAGLDDRDGSPLAGAELTRDTALGEITFGVLRDVGGEHDGTLVEVGWERPVRFAGGRLAPGLALRWQSARYQQAYYGVSPSEATPARAAFDAGTGVDVEARTSWLRPVGRHHRVLLDAIVTRLSKPAADSPLTDARSAARLAVGWLYEF